MANMLLTPSAEVIQGIQSIYERGQTVSALRQAEQFAPLEQWGGAGPCVLAARLAANAGGPRLSMRLTLRAWRADRTHAGAQLQYGYLLSERRGALALWEAMRRWPKCSQPEAEAQTDVILTRGRAAMELRDFATAERLQAEAEALAGDRPWVRLQRSHLLELQDRVEEALDVARDAIRMHKHPFYRPGVQSTAHLLQLLDRDEEAIQFLEEASRTLQNAPVMGQLFGLLSENGRWAEAEKALARYEELAPLIEPPFRKWLSAQRSRAAYRLGKRAEGATHARAVGDEFHDTFAARLEAEPEADERVQLNVTFVRQHFKTCAPATLAAIGRYWQLPAEHLRLAEAMCYDGTPAFQQREWAEQNGWLVREFRATHEQVIELLRRGIPLALSTVEANSAHMQAVSGYDRARGTLLLRDPGQPYTVEVAAVEFFKRYRAFGPRAMVFLPVAEASRLDGVTLVDAELYDANHRFSLGLNRHDRAGAAQILDAMAAAHGDHELVWDTRLHLAGYDANVAEQVRALDRLLELHPGNANRLLRRLSCHQAAAREERIEALFPACREKNADPVLFFELAKVLGDDARRLGEAAHWLKRALRFRPYDSRGISVRAGLLWSQGEYETATELYRFAANLETYTEHLFQAWFQACVQTRRTPEALTILEERFKRYGALSEKPGMTLAWAFRELNQPQRAREVYTSASSLRPENGYILLNAATLEARVGQAEATQRLLDAAKDKVRKADWLATCAEIAEIRLDARSGLSIAREVLELEPLSLDAHGAAARMLARLEGTQAALKHLRDACARFPHHYGLQRLLMDWCREEEDAVAEASIRGLLRLSPTDAWVRRELALLLARTGRTEEALREAQEAVQIEPRNSYSYTTRGHIYRGLSRLTEAREDFRRALALSVDNDNAAHALMDQARTDRDRKEELTFIEGELIRQVVAGDGLLAFQNLARPVLNPEALLESLRFAHKERPDLWHAWSALGSQLAHLNRLDEALPLVQQATERFPHLPRLWLDLAEIHRWRNEPEKELAAAQAAFDINPGWGQATYALCDALERRNQFAESAAIFERALQHSGQNPQLQARYAYLLWRQRKPAEAFAAVERALRLAPGYDWAWELLDDWATERGEAGRAAEFARRLTVERPGDMQAWLNLARVLRGNGTMPERIEACDRALALQPRNTLTFDIKAELLTYDERFDEAMAVTQEGIRNCTVDVHILLGRQAWIESRRSRRPEAIRRMREVLTENASYIWGWNQLAHWLIEEGALTDAEAALEQLQKQRPHDAWVARQLGLLRLKQGNRTGAKQSFTAALQASPADQRAAHELFDLQLESGDLKGAAGTLSVMQLHQPGNATGAAETRLLLRRADMPAARAALEKICQSSDPEPWALDAAVEAFQKAKEPNEALKILKRTLKSGSGNPQAAVAAIHLLLARRSTYRAVRLFKKLPAGEMQRRAAPPLVKGLAEAKDQLAFWWLMKTRRQVMTESDAAWGQVGYAYSIFGQHKQVVRWLADWRVRREVQPWMLFNLCLALRHRGEYPESVEVSRYTLEKWGHRPGSADLRLFLLVEQAIAGDVAGAQQNLEQVAVRENVDYDQDLLLLGKSLVEFLQADVADRPRQFKALKPTLETRFTAGRMLELKHRDIRRTFRRVGKVIVREGGGWKARLWFFWKLNWQWSLLLFTPLLIAPPILILLLILRSRSQKS